MTQFKQIIGRGTRINEDFNKYYFTIMDFKKATELFADPDFDGEPVEVFEGIKHLLKKPYEGPGRTKYVVDDVKVHVIAERVQYYGSDGKLVSSQPYNVVKYIIYVLHNKPKGIEYEEIHCDTY
ncbi:MAG: hypothetical protein K8R25_07520 [Methanosarcinales archaeon]|nr:hypothetical protein [Methanosarcinales archaeon]